jgi:Flp pilus assembly protein TadD
MSPELVTALQKAAEHYRHGRLVEAEAICRRLLSANPKATDVVHLLALVAKQRGDFDEAEVLLRSCIKNDARRADIHANLGNLLAARGRTDDAQDSYRNALSIDASFRPARLGLARLLNTVGQGGEAAQEIQPLIDQNAEDAEAWNVLGTSWRLLGRWEDAEYAFHEALAINPDYAVARHNLGALLAHLSRSEDALAQLDAAAAAGIRGPEIDINRASALMELYRFDDADQVLAATIKVTAQAAGAQTLLARLRFMRGAADFADEYAAAISQWPGDVGLRLGYSRVLRGARLFDRAQEMLEVALEAEMKDPRLLAELAAIHLDAGRFDNALQCARSAARAGSNDSGVDDILIDALTSLGRADEAHSLVAAARKRNPLNQWYVAMEATVARLLGDARYEELYDYEKFVRMFTLSPPPGWSSIEEFHNDLIPALEKRHQYQAEPLDQSLRHGTQTPRGLLGDPDPIIQAFLGTLEEPIAQYRKDLGFDPDHPLKSRNTGKSALAGCWSVRLGRGGYHVNHVHSEGWISSAYYVEVPSEVSDESAKSGWIKFGEPRFRVPGAIPGKFVQPIVGRLVLFPSYMWHGTTAISGNEPRMTIAFDVVPRD